MQTKHIPVLLDEVITQLRPAPGMVLIDGTSGGGGHTEALARRVSPGGTVIAIDRDPQAVIRTKQRLQSYGDTVRFYADTYRHIIPIAHDAGFRTVDGIVLDLGLSSDQLAAAERGFSFTGSAPLDMRFGGEGLSAGQLLSSAPEDELKRIFRDYGDERYAGRIARRICDRRRIQPLETTDQLVEIVEEAYRGKPRPRSIHVATKVFQALRIAVNDEYGAIRSVIPDAVTLLRPGGRLAIISFHSGEDEIVKHLFKQESKGCLCPPRVPICTCGHTPRISLITKKPITASDREVAQNPRSRSAKLRVAEKI